jgi:hypothetical protein
MSPLYARLHLWAVTPHEWGHTDCIMSLSDWVRDQTGRDPGAEYRGRYGDPAVCPIARSMLHAPLKPVSNACRAAGLAYCSDTPRPGDVGLVHQFAHVATLIGALCLGERWASKTAGQGVLIFRPASIRAAWEVGYAQ